MQAASMTENIISAFESAGIIRTFNRETTPNFEEAMPLACVDKGYAWFYKDEESTYIIEPWRIDL